MDNNPNPARMVEYQGQQISLRQLAKRNGINPRTLATRIDRGGMTVEQALAMPVGKPRKKTPGSLIDDSRYGVRSKILNALMETFFEDPDRFREWVREQMDDDYGKTFKLFVMPFLPKDPNALLDKGTEKATISIEFNNPGPVARPVIDVGGA